MAKERQVVSQEMWTMIMISGCIRALKFRALRRVKYIINKIMTVT